MPPAVSFLTPWRRVSLCLAGLLAVVLTGCASQQEQYCETVRENQRALGEAVAQPGAQGLVDALPVYRTLAKDAPDDIADDWRTLIDAVARFDRVVQRTGVDPATYDQKSPPEGLSADERDELEQAGLGLADPEVRRAQAGVEQQALDVCKTPLSM